MRLPAWSIEAVLLAGAATTRAETRVEADDATALVQRLSFGAAETRRPDVPGQIVAWWGASHDALRFAGVSGRWRIARD